MTNLRSNLFLGSYADAEDIANLQANYVTAVLNVAFEINDPTYGPTEIRYIKVGLMDNNQNRQYMKDLAVSTLVDLMTKGEIVLVHCAAGLSRGVYVVAKALAQLENRDIHEVFLEIKHERPMSMESPLFEGEGYVPVGAE